MTRYGMVIDLHRCIGCQACSVACKISNNLPKDVLFNFVHTEGGDSFETPAGTYPNNTIGFRPLSCQHCAEPKCVEVCPAGASQKDPETGIVTIDDELCIGCNSCIKACPYGVRTHIPGDVAFYQDEVFGDVGAPRHLGDTVEKCTFCKPLIERGEEPACMQLCPARARFWGDLDDPESEVSKLIASREYERYLEDEGTEPNCYYLK